MTDFLVDEAGIALVRATALGAKLMERGCMSPTDLTYLLLDSLDDRTTSGLSDQALESELGLTVPEARRLRRAVIEHRSNAGAEAGAALSALGSLSMDDLSDEEDGGGEGKPHFAEKASVECLEKVTVPLLLARHLRCSAGPCSHRPRYVPPPRWIYEANWDSFARRLNASSSPSRSC